jgi:hypothetical protein
MLSSHFSQKQCLEMMTAEAGRGQGGIQAEKPFAQKDLIRGGDKVEVRVVQPRDDCRGQAILLFA